MTQINIPDELYNSLLERAKKKGHESPKEYIISILREIISKLEKNQKKISYSNEEEKTIKNRLKSLGYID